MIRQLSRSVLALGSVDVPCSTTRLALPPLKILAPLCNANGCRWEQQRCLSSKYLTKNLELHSPADNIILTPGKKSLVLQGQDKMEDRQLVIMLSWLMAKRKHLLKFAGFYLKQGFDVLLVSISPTQLMWPMKGCILVGADVLEFLRQNPVYQVLLLHGFSVGAYLWGQTMVTMVQKPNLYLPIADRVAGQIWDSAVDMQSVAEGTANSVFPNNAVLRKSLEACINSHMKVFHNSATVHYMAARELFYNPPVKAPALCLYSLDDPIGKAENIRELQRQWASQGIQTSEKYWGKSSHCNHFVNHREEYTHELAAFLERLGFYNQPTKKKMAL